MDSPALCATSCSMLTADKSNQPRYAVSTPLSDSLPSKLPFPLGASHPT